MDKVFDYAAPLGRLLLALIFLLSGIDKIGNYEQTAQYMAAMSVPTAFLIPTIVLEIGGALALIAGWQARYAAALLAGFSVLAAVLFHANFADQIQMIMFMKNLAIAGGLLAVVAHGAGALALDKTK